MRPWHALVIATGLLTPAPTRGQDVAAEHPAHQHLRGLRDRLVDALNRNDLDRLLQDVTDDAVLTWQNAEVSRGHQGLRDYYRRMMVGPDRVVQRTTAKAQVDELTRLYGQDQDSGLAFGRLEQDFWLTNGMSFHLTSRWTAQVVKQEGRWKVSGFHVSANLFDNPVLYVVMKRTALWTGVVALAAGFALGLLAGWVLGRRRGRVPT